MMKLQKLIRLVMMAGLLASGRATAEEASAPATEAASQGVENKAGVVDVAQDSSPVVGLPKTGQTASYRSGDDGMHQAGLDWPSPRFSVQADTNCVRDNLTGLVWARNADPLGTKNWDDAITYCESLDYGGHSDWRLPNRTELTSLIDCASSGIVLSTGHPFEGVKSFYYWSSTTAAHNTTGAWCVNLGHGAIDSFIKSGYFFVWPVRGGQ